MGFRLGYKSSDMAARTPLYNVTTAAGEDMEGDLSNNLLAGDLRFGNIAGGRGWQA